MTLITRFLLIWAALSLNHSFAQSSLQSYVDKWADDVVLKNAGIGIYVYDLNTNKSLAGYNENMSLIPASTMKVITTASALEVMGEGYRFVTRLQHTGSVDSSGVLHGDLYIKGGGDPSLGSGYYKTYNEDFLDQWVNAVKEAGISKIDGRVIADATLLGENTTLPSWSWGDIGNYYGASPCGLTIYDNKTTISFKSGSNAGDSTWIVKMDPEVPEITIYNKVTASNTQRDNAYIYGGLYDPNRISEGTIPKGKSAFEVKISMHDPAYMASYELDRKLREGGVEIERTCSTVRRLRLENEKLSSEEERETIHKLYGASVGSLCYWTNRVSVNLFAEHLFSGLGLRYYGDGDSYSSAKAIEKYWTKKGVDMTGFYQNDGSGLSRANAVSSKHLVRILKHMNASKNAEKFKESLSIAGKSGTLYSIGRGTSAAGNLIGKSGSMSRVRSYAGYVTSAGGRKLAFAVIVNNYNCNGYQMKQRLEKLLVRFANDTQ